MKPGRLAQQTLARGGLDLACYDAGGRGIPVLLQHGLGASVQQTAEAFPDDARLRLLTLECRGHGASPAGALQDLSIAHFADDVIALIESRALAPVVLGGISMGAAIGLRIAVRRPDLLRALILVRPAWVTDSQPANMRPNAEVGALLGRMAAGPALELFKQSATAQRLAHEAPDNLASLLGFFRREPQHITAELLTRISADGPGVTERDVQDLALPVLLVGHGSDAVHPLAHARRLASLIDQAEFVEITPKSIDREAYAAELQAAIAAFVEKVCT